MGATRITTVVWMATLLACSVAYAYLSVFTTLMVYDDEGTLLLSIREFERGGALYDQVFSPYGPFYYLFKHLYYGILGAPVTHDANRLMTIASWLTGAGIGALFIHRLTRSLLLSSVVYLQLVLHAAVVAKEPGHPQEICFLILVATLLAVSCIDPRRPTHPPLVGVGALLAMMILTKINLGVFLGVSLAMAFVAFAEAGRARAVAACAVSAFGFALPLLLLRGHLPLEWVLHYAMVVLTAWSALCVVVFRTPREGRLSPRHLVSVGAGAALAALVTVGFAALRGSSPAAIFDAIVTAPLRFPLLFLMPGALEGLGDAFALPQVCLTALASAALYSAASPSRRRAALPVLGVAKLAFAEFVFVQANWNPPGMLAYCVPWLWLVIARGDDRGTTTLPRVALAALAAMQALQGYPIGGSQIAWSTILLIPAAALCAFDAWNLLAAEVWRASQANGAEWRRRAPAALLFATCALFYWLQAELPILRRTYTGNRPLDLPGSERIRAPFQIAASHHWWVANLRANCDAFLAIPGYPSLHFWTEIPPLTGFNASGWAHRFGDDLQSRILTRALRVERLCVLRKTEEGLYALPSGGEGPLLRYIDTLAPGFERYAHALLVAPERAPLRTYLSFGQAFTTGDQRYATLPDDLFASDRDLAISAWFRSTAEGTLLGAQAQATCTPFFPPRNHGQQWAPILYVGTDGRLRGHFGSDPAGAITSPPTVNDGSWHHVVLSRRGDREVMYVDGELAGSSRVDQPIAGACAQVGVGYAAGWPATNGDWFELGGEVAEMAISPPLDPAAIRDDFSRGPRLFVADSDQAALGQRREPGQGIQ